MLGETAAAAALAEGRALPLDRLVTYALSAGEPALASDQQDPARHAFAGLTRRELEVLRLLALAQSNREIALELALNEKTVERHFSQIFTKLQVSSRTAAARMAVQVE
jgi:DNA-binding NarL/FixJ family response regulator